MTNGEKLKEIFPYLESDETDLVKVLNIDNLKSWWNAEYKEPTTKNDKIDCQHTDCNNCVNHKYCDYESTTKNDLGVDCVSRADARKAIIDHQYSDSFCEEHNIDHSINTGMALIALSDLPSVTLQEPKPMVEIDLYSVIKQKYIEREVLDKLRAELHATAEMHEDGDYYIRDEWIDEYFDKYMAESE